MREVIIEIKAVSAHYGSGAKQVQALKDVSLSIHKGEIFGLLGPNGAGKSTLLSCIEGLRKIHAGSICVAGQAPAQTKGLLGIQLQRAALMDDLTVRELIEVYAGLYEVYLTGPQIDALLQKFGLTALRDKFARRLSGGQQQRLALAIAISNDPQIVLLDEPTEALDPHARRAMWQIIRDVQQQGRTVILTTHAMEEAEALCNRVAIIDRGQVVACETPAALIARMHTHAVLRASVELPLDEVQALAHTQRAQYIGTHLELETDAPQHTLGALYTLAERHRKAITDLSVRQPNLEDVYLKLTGKSLS